MGLRPIQVDEDRRDSPSFTVGARLRFITPSRQGGDPFFNGAACSHQKLNLNSSVTTRVADAPVGKPYILELTVVPILVITT
jgi:hypothetical protein